MHKILTFYFLLTSLTFAETPRKIGLILGGGRGDDDELINVFKKQGEGFLSNLTKKNYEIRGAFGSQSFSQKSVFADRNQYLEEALDNGKLKTATAQSIEEQLDWILREAENGKIKKDDQIVIQLSTHGNPVGINEMAHSISIPSVEKGKNIEFPLSEKLNVVLQKLNKIGAKTALLDFSCFSGGSLDLARNRSNICVISATNRYIPAQAGKYGDNDAGAFFWKTVQSVDENATSAKDLESLFLSARRMNSQEDLPEISTEEHQRIRLIWDLLFAKYVSVGSDPNRIGHVTPILECSELGVTLPIKDYKIFEDLIRETMKSDKDIDELSVIAKRIKRLAEIRDKTGLYLNKNFGSSGIRDNNINFFNCLQFYDVNNGKAKSLDVVLSFNQKRIEEAKVSTYFDNDPQSREERIQQEQLHMKMLTQKYGPCTTDELKSFMSPKVVEHEKYEAEFSKLKQEQAKLEKKFREKERGVYERLYKEFFKDSKVNNTCRNFVL